MTSTATIAARLSDWLSQLVMDRKATTLKGGAERFAALVSPANELETARPTEEGRPPVVTLTITAGLHQGASMDLKAGEYLVGSGDDCEIVLRDGGVEAHHCRLTREWFGFSIHDLRSAKPRLVAPQTVKYREGEIEAMYDIGGVSLSLRQAPPERPETVSEPLARARRSWASIATIAAALLATTVFALRATHSHKQAQLPTPDRIVTGNQALLAQGFGSTHFHSGAQGELEVIGLVTDAAERERLRAWLRRAHYENTHVAVQPISELVQQAQHALAADNLQVGLHAGRLRIEGTTSELAVKDRIRHLAEDLRGTVEVEDRVTYADARAPAPPAPPLPVRLRGVMVGHPSYFLTDQGARYFVGGVLPDGSEVLAIDAKQIRFASAGKILVYNLE